MQFTRKIRFATVSRWFDGAGRGRAKVVHEPALLLDVPLVEPDAPNSRAPATANRLKLARVFDSAHPVRSREELLGRERELEQLLAATLDFGQHSIVHGARGSGKTSLVRVFGDYADQSGAAVIYMACEPGASFSTLILPYLRSLPASALRPGQREAFARALAALPDKIGPRMVVELLAEHVAAPVVFIFDEFDRVTDPAVKSDIAAAMKLLSDALATVLFILVGIARDVSDVVDAHPSLRRHMRIVALGRISPDSVDALVRDGGATAGLRFDPKAMALLARAACGSPFHVRTFAHHAALAATQAEHDVVGVADVRAGLRTALQNWASMNVADAATFVRLVESGQRLDVLERAARAAAVHDRVDEAGTAEMEGMNLLAEAVRREDGDPTAAVFRDSVAPQFLIAFIILAETPVAAAAAAA